MRRDDASPAEPAPRTDPPATDSSEDEILDAPAVARLLKIGRNAVYEGAARGEIPHRRIGKRLVFCRRALRDWLSWKPAP